MRLKEHGWSDGTRKQHCPRLLSEGLIAMASMGESFAGWRSYEWVNVGINNRNLYEELNIVLLGEAF